MIAADENNLTFASHIDAVDKMNGRFYAKYPFPWPPAMFERIVNEALETMFLSQSIGSWGRCEIPSDGRIWIAGCGTNQAVITALKYPNTSIVATDLSNSSIITAQTSAKNLGLSNLEFIQKSINDTAYSMEFDYVICTGVIHHNADPGVPLQKLHDALKKSGICELMVYNKYH